MADIYTKADVQNLLKGKVVWLLGDSNVRATYKDLVWLLQRNSLISLNSLRKKLEKSHMNDELVQGSALHRGRDYQEVRRYEDLNLGTTIEFMFLTKCLTFDFEEKLKSLKSENKKSPDLVIMNSCLWDILRWGPEGVTNYKRNIVTLMKLLKANLSPETLVIWTTTPPISAAPYGGFLIKQIEFMKHSIRFEVMEANMFVRQEVISHGFDVLDIHYHLLLQIHRRRPDGIHWSMDAVRHITNLILSHVSLSWDHPLPGNFESPILDKMKNLIPEPVTNETKETLEQLDKISQSVRPLMPVRNANSTVRRRPRNRPRGNGNGSWHFDFVVENNYYFNNYQGRRFDPNRNSSYFYDDSFDESCYYDYYPKNHHNNRRNRNYRPY